MLVQDVTDIRHSRYEFRILCRTGGEGPVKSIGGAGDERQPCGTDSQGRV